MLPKFDGIIEANKSISHYIGDRESGDLFLVRFLNSEDNIGLVKSAVTKYISKYVLKNKSNNDINYRAVKSALKIRPFSTSKNLFPRTILRKVKNHNNEPLYKRYSLFDLTAFLILGRASIKRELLIFSPYGEILKNTKENRNSSLNTIKEQYIEVDIDGQIYSWEAGRYFLASKGVAHG